jgi:hypothetical protein
MTGKPQHSPEWRAYAKKVAPLLDQVCHICGGESFDRSGPWQRTVDHLHPLAAGGELCPPLELLRIAHRCCNTRRGNRARAISVNAQRSEASAQRNREQTLARYHDRKRRERADVMPDSLFDSSPLERQERAALDVIDAAPAAVLSDAASDP